MPPRPWSEEDLRLLRDNPDMATTALADKLGRTYQAVYRARQNLARPFRENTEDYDLRPSGWYVECIGTLLTHYQDAFSSWKHYHRYVEVKPLAPGSSGWTYLLCRRDKNAP